MEPVERGKRGGPTQGAFGARVWGALKRGELGVPG